MSIFNQHRLPALLTLLVMLLGCSESAHTLDTKPEGARLSPREAMQIGKRAAESRGKNLRDYEEPTVVFKFPKDKIWSVAFKGRGTMAGSHFTIYVDDHSEDTRLFEGQ